MFGRDAVADRRGLLEIVGEYEQRAVVDARRDDVAPLHIRQMAPHGCRHRVEIGGVGGDQDRLRPLVVFGLGEQVHGDPVGVGAAVADHRQLGGAGDHVDSHLAENEFLRHRDIDIAGTGDLVDRRHGCGAVGHGADGLGAADGVQAVHAGERGGGENHVVARAIRERNRGDDLAHAGDAGRNREHQHR